MLKGNERVAESGYYNGGRHIPYRARRGGLAIGPGVGGSVGLCAEVRAGYVGVGVGAVDCGLE